MYREVSAQRFSRSDQEWQPLAAAIQQRITKLEDWSPSDRCPRSRLIEAWASAAHGPVMAARWRAPAVAVARGQRPPRPAA